MASVAIVGWLLAAPVMSAPAPCQAGGPPSFPPIQLTLLVGGLAQPVGLTHAGDGSGRLFLIEQSGRLRIVKHGRLQPAPFLDLSRTVTAGGEMGLLGLAFHPKFSMNGRFFVHYTTKKLLGGLQSIVSEFHAGPGADHADAGSERIVLTMGQPYENHNGGHLAFGPDGHLYIGFGDGGARNDPHNNGQQLGTLLGKMLRIDVNRQAAGKAYAIPADNPFVGNKAAKPEIWAYGFRNPWRYAFDPATGRLYVGDVGQNAREEIHLVEKGRNYGWRIMEGAICTPGVSSTCEKEGLTPPILDYPHSDGTTVIGGAVYRGRGIPALCGVYVYGDFGNGRVWGLRDDGATVTAQTLLLDTGRSISAFGEDEQRELYVVDYSGKILKITPAKSSP